MGEQQLAVFVDRASLHRYAIPKHRDRPFQSRRAIDDEELGPTEATRDEIFKD